MREGQEMLIRRPGSADSDELFGLAKQTFNCDNFSGTEPFGQFEIGYLLRDLGVRLSAGGGQDLLQLAQS